MVIAARAAGVQCFDTVYTDLDDMDGFKKDVETIHLMGFDGKSIINPRQIEVVHEIFTPSQKDIIFAEKVVKEIDDKKAKRNRCIYRRRQDDRYRILRRSKENNCPGKSIRRI